jgi:hypothetical protein
MRRIVVTGSGSLARAVSVGVATTFPHEARLTVLARGATKAAEIAYVANAAAGLAGRPVTAGAEAVSFTEPGAVRGALGRARPDVVVHCASVQSPWERIDAPSGWTDLLTAAGFGAALPLQALLAAEVAEATGEGAGGGAAALFVNACFPDAVNPLLATLDLPVLCGIGNVALLAASLHAALRPDDAAALRVLAHHVHLHAPTDPSDEARAWLGDERVPDVGDLLTAQRRADRRGLNQVTGLTAARLLAALSGDEPTRVHVPGPHGLPGGYPALAGGGTLRLDLPAGVSEPDAVEFNQRAAVADGVVVERDRVRFAPATADALRPVVAELADGFDAKALPEVADRFLAVCDRLRRTPPGRHDQEVRRR